MQDYCSIWNTSQQQEQESQEKQKQQHKERDAYIENTSSNA